MKLIKKNRRFVGVEWRHKNNLNNSTQIAEILKITIFPHIAPSYGTSQHPSNQHFQTRVTSDFQIFSISQFSTRSAKLLRNSHFLKEFLEDFVAGWSSSTSWSQPLACFLLIYNFIQSWYTSACFKNQLH